MDHSNPLWECPICGRTFANRNQTHTCSPLRDLGDHFRGKALAVRATFDAILEAVGQMGPVTVLPEKTRIALHARMSFAAFMPRRDWLNGHLVLGRRIESSRFSKIEPFSPRNVLHAFRLNSPAEVDDEFIAWLRDAYEVGMQCHLDRRRLTRPRVDRQTIADIRRNVYPATTDQNRTAKPRSPVR